MTFFCDHSYESTLGLLQERIRIKRITLHHIRRGKAHEDRAMKLQLDEIFLFTPFNLHPDQKCKILEKVICLTIHSVLVFSTFFSSTHKKIPINRGNPLSLNELARLDVSRLQCALIMCDKSWMDTDDNQLNGEPGASCMALCGRSIYIVNFLMHFVELVDHRIAYDKLDCLSF